MFSVIISICLMWLLCHLLTITNVFPKNVNDYGYHARTDIRAKEFTSASWVSFPYPGLTLASLSSFGTIPVVIDRLTRYVIGLARDFAPSLMNLAGRLGMPTFNSGLFAAFIAGVITSVIESIGDYYTCARISGAAPPPPSAINRGILIEGINGILSAAVGLGFGVTSCSENIGVISLTKVGSRRVVMVAGLLMITFGCFNKFSAFVVTVPDPIVGGAFITLFDVIVAVGASNLQYVDLNSSRNMVVFGLSLFMGLTLPTWIQQNESLFDGGDENAMQVLLALLGNSMFIACFTALLLDNIIPGTPTERGINIWKKLTTEHCDDNVVNVSKTYDLPFGMVKIRQWKWTKYIPFSPTFSEFRAHRASIICAKCCVAEGGDEKKI